MISDEELLERSLKLKLWIYYYFGSYSLNLPVDHPLQNKISKLFKEINIFDEVLQNNFKMRHCIFCKILSSIQELNDNELNVKINDFAREIDIISKESELKRIQRAKEELKKGVIDASIVILFEENYLKNQVLNYQSEIHFHIEEIESKYENILNVSDSLTILSIDKFFNNKDEYYKVKKQLYLNTSIYKKFPINFAKTLLIQLFEKNKNLSKMNTNEFKIIRFNPYGIMDFEKIYNIVLNDVVYEEGMILLGTNMDKINKTVFQIFQLEYF